MKRALSPPRENASTCLRVPVGTPTGSKECTPPRRSRGQRQSGQATKATGGTAPSSSMPPPRSPAANRAPSRAPLSSLQQQGAGEDTAGFRSPNVKRSRAAAYRSSSISNMDHPRAAVAVAAAAVTGTTNRPRATAYDGAPTRDLELAGGAMRVMTTPTKGVSRRGVSFGGRRESAGVGCVGRGAGSLSHERSSGGGTCSGDSKHPAAPAATTTFVPKDQQVSRSMLTANTSGDGEHLAAGGSAVASASSSSGGPARRRATISRGKATSDRPSSVSPPAVPAASGVGLAPPARELRARRKVARSNSGGDSRDENRFSGNSAAAANANAKSGTSSDACRKRLSSESGGSASGEGGARRVSSTRSTCRSSSSSSSSGSREGGSFGSSGGTHSTGGGLDKNASSTTELSTAPRGIGRPEAEKTTRRFSTWSSSSSCGGEAGGAGGGGGCERVVSKVSAKRDWVGACEECSARQATTAAGGGGEAGAAALCEDCAAESEMPGEAGEASKVSKKPRRSAMMPSIGRRSSAAASNVCGARSGGAEDGEKSIDCALSRHPTMDSFEDAKKPLGRGKFGFVYRAKLKQSRKWVALKLLSKSNLCDSSHQERLNLKREVEIQTKLSHPNIVRMLCSFQDPKWFYLVLDYAAGGDVHKALRLKRTGFSEATAARYLRDAVSAVAYLHENHVIHRDIKTENLLLDSQGRVKLSDFGWAVHAKPPEYGVRHTLCGTPEYAAPEMLVFSPAYTSSVDIWSLGVLGYELLAGRTPFVESSAGVVAASNVNATSASSSPRDPAGIEADRDLAAEVDAVHSGDPNARLYGRIVRWKGSMAGLFGEGTPGADVPEEARDVVSAMLRPCPRERVKAAEVLLLPWLAGIGVRENV